MASSCTNEPEPRAVREEDVVRLFDGIELGSHRSRVESALGRPLGEMPEQIPMERVRAWYLHTPPLPPAMSPYMLGAIEVVYVRDHVVEKTLNPQIHR